MQLLLLLLLLLHFCDKMGSFLSNFSRHLENPSRYEWSTANANDYGQPEGSRKFHSPLRPDIYMDLDKNKIDEEGQQVTVKKF